MDLLLEEQRWLGSELGLHGRVLLASEGINGTVQGSPRALESYQKHTERHFGALAAPLKAMKTYENTRFHIRFHMIS